MPGEEAKQLGSGHFFVVLLRLVHRLLRHVHHMDAGPVKPVGAAYGGKDRR